MLSSVNYLTRHTRAKNATAELNRLFPPMSVPVAPPSFRRAAPRPERLPASPGGAPEPERSIPATFLMQLSPFDSSHRTGAKGTSEALIPQPAMTFFPPLARAGRRHPDAYFEVVLNTPPGRERHSYRVWYYKTKDENRLRMDKQTIDLTASEGGDLLVISRLPGSSSPPYEVTVVGREDPSFEMLLDLCQQDAQGKRWGFATV